MGTVNGAAIIARHPVCVASPNNGSDAPNEQANKITSQYALDKHGVVLKSHDFKESLMFLGSTPKEASVFKYKGIAAIVYKGPIEGVSGQTIGLEGRQVVVLKSGNISTHDTSLKYLKAIGEENKKSSFNPGVLSDAYYVAGDIPSIPQNIVPLIAGASSLGIQQGVKFSSAFSLVTGSLRVITSAGELKVSKKIGDVFGTMLNVITLIRGSIEILSGAVMAAFRTLSIIAAQTAAKVVVLWTSIIGIASTFVGSAVYTALALPFAIKGIQSFKFLHEYNKLETPQDKYEFLKGKLMLNEVDYKKAQNEINFQDEADLYTMLKDPIVLTEAEEGALCFEDKDEIRKRVNELLNGINKSEFSQIGEWDDVSAHLQIRMGKEVARMKLVKEAAFLRRCGNATLQKLKEHLRLTLDERKDVDLTEVLKLAHDETKFQTLFYALIVLTCMIGIAGMIITTVMTGGIPLIIGTVMMLVTAIFMLGIDGYCFLSDLKSKKKSGVADKILFAVLGILSICCAGVGAFFSGGLLPLIVVLLVGLIMLGITGAGMHWSYKNSPKDEDNKEA